MWKSNLIDELPLTKTIEIHSIIIVVGAAFHKNIKYYPHVFLDEWIIWKLQIMNNIKKLYYGRIDVSEEIDVYRTSKSKECNVFHYWYFLNKGFNF